MIKPAPGPYDWLAIGANASGGFHLYVTDINGRKIAAVWGSHPEKEATARVFAAAPEMLAELKKLRRMYPHSETQEIIDKAEGKP